MVIGCCCQRDFSSASIDSNSVDSASIFSNSNPSQSQSVPIYVDNDCPCCTENVLPQRYHWICSIPWDNIFGVRCPAYFTTQYNDTELYYRGTAQGLPPGYVQCRWTTQQGYVASNQNNGILCANACYDSPAFGGFGFIPAITLTLKRDGVGAPCMYEAQVVWSQTVGRNLSGVCLATGPLIGFFWRQDLVSDPFSGCINNYRLKRFGMFTPNVDANIYLL